MYLFKVSFYFNLSKDFGDRSVSYLNSSPGQQLTLLGWIVDPEKYFIRKYFVDLLKIFCEIFLPRHPAILPAVIAGDVGLSSSTSLNIIRLLKLVLIINL